MRFAATLAMALGAMLVSVANADTYTTSTLIDYAKDEGNTDVTVNTGVVLTVTGSISNIAGDINIGSAGTEEARLLVDGGVVGDEATPEHLHIGYNCPGVLEITNGGTVYAGYAYTGRITGQTGSIIISGGTLNASSNVYLGYSGATTVTCTQSGGTVNANYHLYVGYGTDSNGTYTISGGTLNLGRQFYVGDADSVGRFQVIGSAATINANPTMSTTNRLYVAGAARSTFGFTLDDSAGHISCINAYYTQFASGATIDMSLDGFTPTVGQTFDLIKDWDGGITISTLVLAADDIGVWELQTNDDGDTLQAKYVLVPEPATMGLLGFGLIGIVLRRRTR